MAQTLLITDGPDEGLFDSMINHDDFSRQASFITEEEGELTIYCAEVKIDGPMNGKGNDITVSNEKCNVVYDSIKKTGIMTIFN